MLYDLSNKVDLTQAQFRFKKLTESGATIDLTEKKRRTTKQNNYLHLILSWFALETAYTLEFVKREYFKLLVNPEIFVIEKDGKLGKVKDIRSSADLDSKELTTAIDRFKIWASNEAGVYLPDANEDEFLKHIEIEISRKKEWL